MPDPVTPNKNYPIVKPDESAREDSIPKLIDLANMVDGDISLLEAETVQNNGSTWTPHIDSYRTDQWNRFSTDFGYVDIGPANANHAHIYTNRPNFYFNKELRVNGATVYTQENDGAGSGLDAGLLGGYQPSDYLRKSEAISNGQRLNGIAVGANGVFGNTPYPYETIQLHAGSNLRVLFGSLEQLILQNNGVMYINGGIAWTGNNDGAGSGLDADLFDGMGSGSFAKIVGSYDLGPYLSGVKGFHCNGNIATASGSQSSLEVKSTQGSGTDAFMTFHVSGDHALYFGLDGGVNDIAVGGWSKGAVAHRVWHAGNDGAGSGLDADTLDGQGGEFWSGIKGDYNASTTVDQTHTGLTVSDSQQMGAGNAPYLYGALVTFKRYTHRQFQLLADDNRLHFRRGHSASGWNPWRFVYTDVDNAVLAAPSLRRTASFDTYINHSSGGWREAGGFMSGMYTSPSSGGGQSIIYLRSRHPQILRKDGVWVTMADS